MADIVKQGRESDPHVVRVVNHGVALPRRMLLIDAADNSASDRYDSQCVVKSRVHGRRVNQICQPCLAHIVQPLKKWAVEDRDLPSVELAGSPDGVTNRFLCRVPFRLIVRKALGYKIVDAELEII